MCIRSYNASVKNHEVISCLLINNNQEIVRENIMLKIPHIVYFIKSKHTFLTLSPEYTRETSNDSCC